MDGRSARASGRCVPSGALDNLSPLLRRRSDRCAQLALVARQAWAMAASVTTGIDPNRVAVVVGTGIGGLATMHEQHTISVLEAPTANPLTVPMLIPDAAAGQVAIDLGVLGGPRRFQPAPRRRSPDAGSDAAQR